MVMKMNARKAVGIIAVILLVLIVFSLFSNVVILAQDDTEGNIPGVDMAALWSLNGGFNWIYPGSSFDEQGRTLHNIYMLDDPYGEVDAIFKYTLNSTPFSTLMHQNYSKSVIICLTGSIDKENCHGQQQSLCCRKNWPKTITRSDLPPSQARS